MKKLIIVLTTMILSACGSDRIEIVTIKGQQGIDGYSIVVKTYENPEMCGPDGGTNVLLALDLNRNLFFDDGDQIQTQFITCNGLNGNSCTVNKVGSNAAITCGTTSVVVSDGVDASGIYITEILNPCGVEFANDEVLLKLSNGRILALYDGGPHQDRLTLLTPGNYITTDAVKNKSCSFTVTNNYQITNEVRH